MFQGMKHGDMFLGTTYQIPEKQLNITLLKSIKVEISSSTILLKKQYNLVEKSIISLETNSRTIPL